MNLNLRNESLTRRKDKIETMKTVAPSALKAKIKSKDEITKADLFWRKSLRKLMKAREPSITEEDMQETIDELVPPLIKAFYKSDTQAVTKLMNMAYGKPK